MGSGDKFQFMWLDGFGLGFNISRFPHSLSISIMLIKFYIYIGFGKGYDEV